MKTYVAHLMDAADGGTGVYEFEEEDDLMHEAATRVVARFMQHAAENLIPDSYKDYDLNAAFKNDRLSVVTGIGSLELLNDPPIPFMVMISRKKDAPALSQPIA